MGNETVEIEFNETSRASEILNVTFLINGTVYLGLNNTGYGVDYWNYTWTVPVGLGTGNHIISAQMRNYSGGLLATATRTIVILPRLDSVSVSSSPLKGGTQIVLTAVNENDPDNGTLIIYCGETTTPSASNNNCTNSDGTPPYSLACAFDTETDTANHTKYCRVYNGQYYSKTSTFNYTTDSSPPSTTVLNVSGDTTVPYYDTTNDGFTNISISGEASMVCRYSLTDQTYTQIGDIGQDCTVTGTQALCTVQPAQGAPDYYVSCQDSLGNDQSTSQNLDVTSITVDWTAPTTSDNSNTNVHVPTYQVTITEADNVDGDPESYYCTDATGACTPTTAIDNGGIVSFTSSNRGLNYLIYYSTDYVGNSQAYENKTININQLANFTGAADDAGTIKGGATVTITTNSSDVDSGQTIKLFVCNSTNVNSSGCVGSTYCSNITGSANSTCSFTSETDDTTHTWYAYIYDSLNESAPLNYSGSYTTDSTAPTITVLSPTNGTTYTTTSITAQISLSAAGNITLYSLDEGANISMTRVTDTSFTADISGLADQQEHNITFYANDSLGNIDSSSTIFFTVDTTANDTTAPSIMVLSPTNNSFHTTAILLNISLNENGSSAWYSLDYGTNTTLGNESKTSWNATITPSQAEHNIIFYANDTSSRGNAGASDVITFTYDTTAPQFSSASYTPSTVNDNASVTCYSSWTDNVQLSIGIVGENSTGTFVNHTISLSGTSNDVNYTISSSSLAPGDVTCTFYANDTTGNLNSTSVSFTVNDATPPSITDINYSPSTEAELDLNARINITANVTDNYNVSSVILQYKQANASTFSNFTMNNTSGDIYYGNFTPNAETNWTFRILAQDNAGNQNISAETNLSIAQENTFAVGETLDPVESITITDNRIINLGNITVNNTGDTILNFSITSDVSWLNLNGTGNNAINFSLNSAGSSGAMNVTANTTGLSVGLYNYSINITGSYNNSQVNSTIITGQINIQTVSGPYLVATIDTYSASVTKGETGVELSATVNNYGTSDADGVWLVWDIPSEFTVQTGSLSRSIGVLPVMDSATNTITVSVSSSSDDKNVAINATANSTQDSTDTASKTVAIGSPPATPSSPGGDSSSGGGGGGGGTGTLTDSVELGQELISSSEIFELIRGQSNSFPIDVQNVFRYSSLQDVTIRIEGLLSKYMSFSPDTIDIIEPGETGQFLVTITSPEYMEEGEHLLVVMISGRIMRAGVRKDLVETREVTLRVHSVSAEEANESIKLAASDIEEMRDAGFPTTKISELLEQAKISLEQNDYEDAKATAEKISSMKETSFKAQELMSQILDKIEYSNLITGAFFAAPTSFSQTQELLRLVKAAFEREDYGTALQRAKDAQMTLALEGKEFNLIRFLMQYWWVILVTTAILSVAGVVSYQTYTKNAISQKIDDYKKRDETLRGMMQEAQQKYFKDRSIGTSTFHRTMTQYQQRLLKTRQLRSELRHKRAILLKPEKLIKDLEEERQEVFRLMKVLQQGYFVNRDISKTEYDEQLKLYNERLAEIEDEQLTMEIMLSMGGKK